MFKLPFRVGKRSSRYDLFFFSLSWLSVLFLFLLGMWQFHNTEFYSNFDLVPGGRGDPRLVTALLEYFHQALHGIGKIGSPAFYYPTRGTLGYADVFFSYAI